jgi:hypothetical protein
MSGMPESSRRGPYHLVLLEQGSSRRFLRVLIAGPGAEAGVWYCVSGRHEAIDLVESLNESYFYSRQIGAARASKRSAAGLRAGANPAARA